jgi:hypothetical protein
VAAAESRNAPPDYQSKPTMGGLVDDREEKLCSPRTRIISGLFMLISTVFSLLLANVIIAAAALWWCCFRLWSCRLRLSVVSVLLS